MKLKLITVVFLFIYAIGFSQEKLSFTYKNMPISAVLDDLETGFDVKFSFDSELLEYQFFNYRNKQPSLSGILLAIAEQTDLEFQKISQRYYIINKQIVLSVEETQDLDEVLITEYLTSGIKKKSDGSIVLTPKNLGLLPGLTEPDVLQSLQLLPGIKSPNETATELYVRGGTPDQNLVLWDDIKIYNSGHFFGSISAFNPYIIKNVKLFTNGTKARYGNRVSSVIDISSFSEVPLETNGGFGFNMTHSDVFIKTPLTKKIGLIVSTRRSYTDVLNTFTFKNLSTRVFQSTKISEGNTFFVTDPITITKDFFRFSDLTAKVIYEPSIHDKILLSTLLTKNKLDYEFFNEAFKDRSTDFLDIHNTGVSLRWNHKYRPNLSHAFKAYKSEYNLEYKGDNFFREGFSDSFLKRNHIEDYGLTFHFEWTLNSNRSVNFGYDFSYNAVSYGFNYTTELFDLGSLQTRLNSSDSDINNMHAGYVEYQYKKADKWLFNVGLRANNTSLLNEFYVEPRFNAELTLNPFLKLKLSGEQLHQNIVQIEELVSNNFGLESELWVLSKKNIAPLLKSDQIALGLNFNKSGWNVDLDIYKKRIKGLTSFSRGFSTVEFAIGENNVVGVDVVLKKKNKNYRTWLGYSLVKNDFKFKNLNNNVSFPANFHITNQVNWSHSYIWDQFSFSLGWNYRTGAPYTKGIGIKTDDITVLYDKLNAKRLPNYHRLDFSSTYKFDFSKHNNLKAKIGFSLFNIYNKRNVLSKTYEVGFTDDGSVLRAVEKISLGVTPNFVFRVEF